MVLKKYSIDYFQCSTCGFAQTEDPHWLSEAYSNSMNLGDTGQVARNMVAANVLNPIISIFLNPNDQFLDYAGGYGLFTRMMRDKGFNYYWDDKYTPNLIGKGFERPKDKTQFELVSTFECFEHWVEPMIEIETIFSETDSLFFTTNLISRPAPKPEDWWYYGFDHGQHVAFHSKDSLQFVAQKLGLHFHSKRGFHLLTRKKISGLGYKLLVEFALRNPCNWLISNRKSLVTADHERLISSK